MSYQFYFVTVPLLSECDSGPESKREVYDNYI